LGAEKSDNSFDGGGNHMRRWVTLIVIIVIAAGAFFAVRTIRERQNQQIQESLETVEAERGTLIATIGASGSVEANQTGTVAFQTTGIVGSVSVQFRDEVLKGEVLASLDPDTLSTQLILAQADLVSAEKALEALLDTDQARAVAQLNIAQARDVLEDAEYKWYVQQEGNRASGETIAATEANLVLAQKEVDKAQEEYSKYSGRPEDDPVRALARANLAAARQKRDSILRNLNWYLGYPSDTDQAILDAELEVARANLREAEQELEKIENGPDPDDVAAAEARIAAAEANLALSQIEAPFSGTVTSVDIKPGDAVSPGQPVVQVADLSRLYVQVDVSEVDVNRVKVGQEVRITFDADLEQAYKGEVIEVGLVGVDVQGVVNFKLTVEMLNADEDVRPGMTAAVNIVVNEVENALLVPNRAVRVRDGKRIVYVLKNGVPETVDIELGASSDLFSEVIDGELREGDLIVLNPPSSLMDMEGGGRGPFGGF
jgi:HlyD family secretion protein